MTSSHARSGLETIRRGLLAAPLMLVLSAAGLAGQGYEGYSYFRTVDGRAELIDAESGERTEVETNYPVITGDRLLVEESARVDLLLSDGSQLSVDEVSDLSFAAVAGSPDGDEGPTELRLYEGRILLASRGVWRDGDEAAIVDTANARIYLQSNGTYLVSADEARWTEVVVRDGFAEVVDQNGSSVVRPGERLEVRGNESPRTSIEPAGAATSIESFADRQEVVVARASDPRLDEPLHSTASLADQGEWVVIDSRQAWRPTVTVREWRPYWRGRWAHTPAGLYWVSYDPWSPVVYHYGAWDYHAAFGWVWYPGRVYSPGHVYWYWGPSYAGWVPRGYYDHYYRRHYGFDFGFRFGVFGHIGGSFASFDRWTFCPIGRFGYRGYSHYVDTRTLRYLGRGHLEKGYLFTDTRRLTRDRWHRPELVQIALERGWRSERGLPERGAGAVPDVTPFVERKGRLTPETERHVLVKGRQAPRTDDPFPTRVAARPRGGTGDGAGRSITDRRPTVDRGATSSGRTASSRSERGTPRAITQRPGDGDSPSATTERSALRRPSVSRDSGASTSSTRAAPARRVLDGIRGRTQGSSQDRGSVDSRSAPTRRQTVTPPSRGSSTRSTAPPSRTTTRSAPPSRSSSTRSTAPPSRTTTRSAPPSRSSSTRSTTPPSRSTTRSAPPSRGSSTRSTAPRSRSGSSRVAAPRSRSSSSSRSRTPPTRSSRDAVRSSAPRSRSSARTASPSGRSSTRSTASSSRGRSPASTRSSGSAARSRSTDRPSGMRSSSSPPRRSAASGRSSPRSSGSRATSRGSSTRSRSSATRSRSGGSRSSTSRPSRSSSRRPPGDVSPH
ncbi:MAG TPA: DUF6600 domain-containing protein [Thermoanaerobaculia bacterium]|nr:DUF6600 domain-containing protein [Thermoanaerobaculia bacterium]